MKAAEWIDSLELPDADKAMLKGIADKKPDAFNGFLAQNEFSRKMNELDQEKKRLQEEFDRKQADVDSYKNTLISTRGKIDKEYKSATTQRDNALARLQAMEAKAAELAEQYGFEVSELGLNNLPPANGAAQNGNGAHANRQSNQNPDPDEPSKYYTRDEAFADAAGHALLLAKFNDLVTEYQDLTGKRPAGATAMMEKAVEALKAGKPQKFDELFDQTYGMADLRQKASEKANQEREEAIRRDERQKVMSEQLVNQTHGANAMNGSQSPALRFAEKRAAAGEQTGPTAQQQRAARIATLLQEEAVKAAS